MHDEWIKLRNLLWDDPRIVALAVDLGEHLPNPACPSSGLFHLEFLKCVVLGALSRMWSLADQYTLDGALPHYTPTVLNDVLGMEGLFDFAGALMRMDWLRFQDGRLIIPRFSEHNGQSAKARHQNTLRQQKRRARVALVSRVGSGAVATKKEKENKKKKEKHSSSSEECKEELPQKEVCPELAADGRSGRPPLLVFPTVGKGPKEWNLTEAKRAEYQESFPGADVLAECRKARQWCLDNPTKRKTARGMPAFLTRWLGKAQDSGRAAGPPAPRKSRESSRQEVIDQWLQARQNTPPGSSTTPTASDSATPTPPS